MQVDISTYWEIILHVLIFEQGQRDKSASRHPSPLITELFAAGRNRRSLRYEHMALEKNQGRSIVTGSVL